MKVSVSSYYPITRIKMNSNPTTFKYVYNFKINLYRGMDNGFVVFFVVKDFYPWYRFLGDFIFFFFFGKNNIFMKRGYFKIN